MYKQMTLHPLSAPVQRRPSRLRRAFLFTFRLMLPVLLFACVAWIFGNSLEIGALSGLRSQRVTELLNRGLARLGTGLVLEDALVRKLAHFSEYAALGLLLMLCIRVYTARILGSMSWPLFLGLLVAVVDECIQLSMPGRAGLVTDVLIDFAGVLLGVLLAIFLLLIGKQFWSEISLKKA